jgi:hypothetical protein
MQKMQCKNSPTLSAINPTLSKRFAAPDSQALPSAHQSENKLTRVHIRDVGYLPKFLEKS